MKQELLALRDELLKAAEENERELQVKCAQVLLAASGMAMLRDKLGLEKDAGVVDVAKRFAKDVKKEGVGEAVRYQAQQAKGALQQGAKNLSDTVRNSEFVKNRSQNKGFFKDVRKEGIGSALKNLTR